MSEILAPCGSTESLIAAVNAGADAVYLGEEYFSARKNAVNFNKEQLIEAVRLCHYSGVKVYVTLNTLVFDKELLQLSKAIEECAKADVDAFIVQDLAAARLTKQIVPQMELHASTQMTVNSLKGAIAVEKLGFSRVVLGRELSFEQIKYICDNCSIETEVFVHGALCVCISGQCYMSSMLGGRSGNRGLCAQPCRLNFSCENRQNVLSLKDLSVIDKLPELDKAGVASFKIEGRMKRPEYVAGAVNACRNSLDGIPPDLEALKCVFSRSGFTAGYYNDNFADMQGIRTKDDVISAPKALSAMKQLYHRPYKRFEVDIASEIVKDKPIKVKASACGVSSIAIGTVPQAALNRSITDEYVNSQLSKLGGTVYSAENVSSVTGENLSVPASELNELRRKVISSLSEKILEKNSHHYEILKPTITVKLSDKKIRTEIRCEVSTAAQLEQVLCEDEYGLIYAPMDLLDKDTPDKFRIAVVPPVFLADCEADIISRLKKLKEYGYEHAAAHTISHLQILNELGYKAHGTFRMNITNTLSLDELIKFGLYDAVLSPELLINDAKDICKSDNAKCGILAYGSFPLMITRRCPISNNKPCGKNKRKDCPHKITDRQGNEMKCFCSDNTVEIYNPDILVLSDRQKDLNCFDFVLLKFTDEADTGKVLQMYLGNMKPEGKLTRGLYYRGVQ